MVKFKNYDILFRGEAKLLSVADMGEGGSKMAKKVLTYFMDGP